MARRMFLQDLRELDRMSFPELQLIMQLLSHFTPLVARNRANAKDPPYEEIVLPGKLRRYSADPSASRAFFNLNQLMANFISRELARGEIHLPSYTPYIAADVSVAPWLVPAAEHTLAIAKWPNNRQAKKADHPQRLPFHAWLMYRPRFIFTADIFGAWAPFGGISSQLNNISVLLHLATTENIATAIAYDAILSTHLAESARASAERTVGAVDFADLLSPERPRFKIQAAAQCVRTPNAPPVKQTKNPKPDKKPETERTWLPQKEYVAKLADDKAASADQAQPSSPNRGRKRSPGRKRSRSPSRRHRFPAKDTRQEISETEATAHPLSHFWRFPKLRMTPGEPRKKSFPDLFVYK